MYIQPKEKFALFIDGANLYASAKALEVEIDYEKLLDYFSQNGDPLRAYYYTAMPDDGEYSPIRPLIDWLEYNGYTLVTKPVRTFTDKIGHKKLKGNMDIELVVDCMELVDHLDHFVIFSGDGDFIPLIRSLHRKGKKVTIVSTACSSPPILSDDLRRVTDYYIGINELRDIIGRPANPDNAENIMPDKRNYAPNPRTDSPRANKDMAQAKKFADVVDS